jgi:N-acetyl-beta-hexosaminidase
VQEVARTFGSTDMIHIGGDEVETDCLEDSSEVQQYMHDNGITDPKQILADYQTFLGGVMKSLKMTPIVWQEVLYRRLDNPKLIFAKGVR